MSTYIGDKALKECYIGSDKVKEIYIGSDKVWSSETLTLLHQLEYTMGVDRGTDLAWSESYSLANLQIGDRVKIVVDVLSGDDIVIKPDSIAAGQGFNSLYNSKESKYEGPFSVGQQYVQYVTLQDISGSQSYQSYYDVYLELQSNYNTAAWGAGEVTYRVMSKKYNNTYNFGFERYAASNWIDGVVSTKIKVSLYKVES